MKAFLLEFPWKVLERLGPPPHHEDVWEEDGKDFAGSRHCMFVESNDYSPFIDVETEA